MHDPRSAVAPVDDRIVHLSTLLPVPPETAFGYFTTEDLLQQWLAPSAKIDPCVGGRYELFWDPDDPENDSTIGCRITALATDELIAFQ